MGWSKPKFYTKCKSLLKHTRIRVEQIKTKRAAVEMFLMKDIADLLKEGLDYNAYLRADMLLVEQNMTACYDFVERFALHISNHLSDMQEKEGHCPLQCEEAAASLAFAAARFGDLPDLRELRSLFTQRYGSSYESCSNKKFMEKCKAHPPTKDMMLRLLRDIADELSIKWDSQDLEQKLYTQQDSSKDNVEDERPSNRRRRRPVSEDNVGIENSDEHTRADHSRSSSVELGSHVHPKMPDYDQLAARVTALSKK